MLGDEIQSKILLKMGRECGLLKCARDVGGGKGTCRGRRVLDSASFVYLG